jgi:hypothetical protein
MASLQPRCEPSDNSPVLAEWFMNDSASGAVEVDIDEKYLNVWFTLAAPEFDVQRIAPAAIDHHEI